MRHVMIRCVGLLGCWAIATSLFAQAAGGAAADAGSVIGAKAPEFPSSPEAWVNSIPLSVETVAGKGVVLYFVEETNQACQKAWPGVLDSVKEFDGKPVLFIGVISGVPKQVVQAYASQFGIPWPMIADVDRSLEKAYGVGEINDTNFTQMMYIKSDGVVGRGDYKDMKRSTEAAMKDAKWKLDPATVPDTLKPAWFAIEFGDPSKAALLVKKSLTSRKADEKAAAENLKAIVQNSIEKLVAEAKKAADEGKKWDAYAIYAKLTDDFKGFDLPPEVQTQKKELGASTEIKAALAARKTIDNAKRLAATGKGKAAATMLKKVVDDMAGNSLGQQAQALIDQIGSP